MNQKWYRAAVTKAVLIVVAHIMVAVMAVSVLRITIYPAIRDEVFDGNPAQEYKDCSDFADRMWTYSARAVGEISAREIFETNREYDPDKLVDIELYYDTGMIEKRDRKETDAVSEAEEESDGEDVSDSEESPDEKEDADVSDAEEESGERLLYRLGDLLSWYDIRSNGEQSPAEQIVVCKGMDDNYRYYEISDFYTQIKSGGLQFIAIDEEAGYTEQNILQNMEFGTGMQDKMFRGIQDEEGKLIYSDCWLYDGNYFLEEFVPVNTSGILEVANEKKTWNGKLDEIFTMLDVTLNGLGNMYASYQEYGDGLAEGDTNFHYIYVDLNEKRVYTNKKEYEAYVNLQTNLDEIMTAGSYAIVRPKLADFKTDLDLEAEYWRDVVKYTGPAEGEFIFAASVDTDYPIQDEFYRENRMYAKYRAGVRRAELWTAVAAVICLICVLWLAAAAGRNNRDEELHLNGFDHWKTEPAAAVVILGWAVIVFFWVLMGELFLPQRLVSEMSVDGLVQQTTYQQTIDSGLGLVWCAFLAGWTLSMFLVGFLSLVRRWKARSIWKNSLVRGICRFTELMFKNINVIWKTVLLFAGFVLIQLFFYIELGVYMDSVFRFLVLLANAGVFGWLCYRAVGQYRIKKGIQHIAGGEVEYMIPVDGLFGEQKAMAEMLNRIGEGLETALAENMKNERLKTDLITNVSHDIKTPLTSIINYVELLKQENFEDPKLQRYIEVLEQKSQRLKTLTEDVVEASKVSSGNITLEYMELNFAEMLQQTSGEFEEKFKARRLTEILTLNGEGAVIRADGRRTWRVLENIYNNAAKYAMEGTRIYGDLNVTGQEVCFSLKNVSEQPLNISADELTERFIRGDISRSTEGSGLGLSIAKTLTEMQGGKFELYLDGDLFKVMISFPKVVW